jgi:DNA-binding XRE family transcriptional regulator
MTSPNFPSAQGTCCEGDACAVLMLRLNGNGTFAAETSIMTIVDPGLESLGELRSFCLHAQSPAETRQMGAAAGQLRRLRQTAGYSRPELAARLGVGVGVIVAIENGYGSVAVAQPLLDQARRLPPRHSPKP